MSAVIRTRGPEGGYISKFITDLALLVKQLWGIFNLKGGQASRPVNLKEELSFLGGESLGGIFIFRVGIPRFASFP